MCCSRTKKCVFCLLVILAAVFMIWYFVSLREEETESRGTLVRAVRTGGEYVEEKLKDGGMFLCEKINAAARKL